jgi:predicted NAD/FAD-dependent oxidoreductase
VAAQLGAWFGRATARWSHLATVRVPHALPRYPVGGEPAPSPRLAPGLYACGDHREHPSLNGALHSGRRAADAVLADLA